MRPLLCLAAFIFTLTAPAENQPLRDPFWPIGFTPGHDTPAAGPEPVEPEAAPVVLSDDELRELAREEARNIQASLETQGIAIMGGRIYGFIQGRWVTVGDSFTTQVLGREYRLLITRLTATEIELEPFRIPTQ
ncbi:MAG: hypothetical protein JJU05_09585 [Verrucomicrobia bacterium]|nr:hypothetical protein [Verrucomicrobiota bacterium]MCH8525998.1 hypothetical protein [Kiritimatiellia bacterium]